MQRVGVLALGVCLVAWASAAVAADVDGAQIATSGANGAPACLACHGLDGAGMDAGGFPRLAGMDAAYLSRQLAAFKAGQRTDPTMSAVGAALDAQQAAAVSSYYAAMAPPAAAAEAPDPQGLGRELALFGDWSKDVPGCVQCHGPGGRGVGETFPTLAGQHRSYLIKQLTAWQSGERKGDPGALMETVARRLTQEEIEAVASWFASQPAVAQ